MHQPEPARSSPGEAGDGIIQSENRIIQSENGMMQLNRREAYSLDYLAGVPTLRARIALEYWRIKRSERLFLFWLWASFILLLAAIFSRFIPFLIARV